MKISLIRHGDPNYLLDTLTNRGHKEAKALADRLANTTIDMLYSSPLGRALATANYTSKKIGKEVVVLDWIREIENLTVMQNHPYGKTAAWDLHGSTIKKKDPVLTTEAWLDQGLVTKDSFLTTWKKITSESDALFGSYGFVRHHRNIYHIEEQASRNLHLAFFAHGGFGLTWLSYLLNIPVQEVWASFFLFPSSVTTIIFDEREKGTAVPRCIGLSDLSHLYASGLEPSVSGLKANTE
jgi:broad specificity phosphatase PhoE